MVTDEKETLKDLVEMLNEDELTELVRFISERHLNCISKVLCEETMEIKKSLNRGADDLITKGE